MSGLINSPFSQDKNFVEAIVTSVDVIRYTCNVKTSTGKMFSDVTWLLPTGGSKNSGMHFGPKVGDKVLVSTSLTYPLILGSLPRIGLPDDFSSPVGTSPLGIDPGSSMGLRNGYVGNSGKPQDFTSGDVLITNDNGGLLGLLSAGTAVVRGSRLAQVICSKFDDLVRVVARNYERIHDWGEETVYNFYGRLYRYIGFNRKFDKSKLSIYEYEVYEGDVAAAEYGKATPFGKPNSAPPTDTVVRKKVLHDSTGALDVFVETLEEEGVFTIKVINPAHHSERLQTNSTIRHMVDDISKITITPTNIVVDFNGEAVATFDTNGIDMQAKGHYVTINSSGVHMG